MSVAELVLEIVIIVVCAGAGGVVLARPAAVWSLGRRLGLCRGDMGATYKSVSWIVGVVLVAIAVIHLVTTALALTI